MKYVVFYITAVIFFLSMILIEKHYRTEDPRGLKAVQEHSIFYQDTLEELNDTSKILADTDRSIQLEKGEESEKHINFKIY